MGILVIWSYDASTNVWAVVSTYCQAAGTVSPNFPSDYGIMVYDPGRDRVWWLGQGDGFPPGQGGALRARKGASGWPTGSIRRNGFLWLDPNTNTWTKTSEQATSSNGGGTLTPTGDRIINIKEHRPSDRLGDGVNASNSDASGEYQCGEAVARRGQVQRAAGARVLEPRPREVAWDNVNRIAYVPTKSFGASTRLAWPSSPASGWSP